MSTSMSDIGVILAQAQAVAQKAAGAGWQHLPHHWPGQAELLNVCDRMGPLSALIVIGVGAVYLLWGYSFHKILVTLNATVVGTAAGFLIGRSLGGGLHGAILGGVCTAAVTWPMMKWAVAVMAALWGAVIGGCIWRAAGLDLQFVWAGAMMGLIACGLFCFILNRGSITAYMSLQGAAMIVVGILAFVYQYDSVAPTVTRSLQGKPFLLPLAIFISTVLGLVYQQSGSAPAPAPAGGGGGDKGASGGAEPAKK